MADVYYDSRWGGTQTGAADTPFNTMPTRLDTNDRLFFANGSTWDVTAPCWCDNVASSVPIYVTNYSRAAAPSSVWPIFGNTRVSVSGDWTQGSLNGVGVFVAGAGNIWWTSREMMGWMGGQFWPMVDATNSAGGGYATITAENMWASGIDNGGNTGCVVWSDGGTNPASRPAYSDLRVCNYARSDISSIKGQGAIFGGRQPRGGVYFSNLSFDFALRPIKFNQRGPSVYEFYPTDADKSLVINNINMTRCNDTIDFSASGDYVDGETTRGWRNLYIGALGQPIYGRNLGRGIFTASGCVDGGKITDLICSWHNQVAGIASVYLSSFCTKDGSRYPVEYSQSHLGYNGPFFQGGDGSGFYADHQSSDVEFRKLVIVDTDKAMQTNWSRGNIVWHSCVVKAAATQPPPSRDWLGNGGDGTAMTFSKPTGTSTGYPVVTVEQCIFVGWIKAITANCGDVETQFNVRSLACIAYGSPAEMVRVLTGNKAAVDVRNCEYDSHTSAVVDASSWMDPTQSGNAATNRTDLNSRVTTLLAGFDYTHNYARDLPDGPGPSGKWALPADPWLSPAVSGKELSFSRSILSF